MKNFIISSTCFAIVLFTYSCSGNKETVEPKQALVSKEFERNMKTVKANRCNQDKEMSLTGRIISDPDRTIHYVPLISGVIERTYFSLGDKVEKGKPLMDIRSAELSALHSQQIALESEVKIAERALKSAENMYEDQMLSEKELFEIQGKLAQSKAELYRIKSDMALFGTNKGDGSFSIKAPMGGYIIDKNVSSGSTVSPESTPLFTIADLSSVWVIANVYASNLLFVREGMEADITTLSYPNEVFKGKINAISQVFDPEDKALKARIVLPNKELKFKSEMSAVIKLKDTAQNGLVSIPSDALIFDNDKYYVIAKTDKEYQIKQVTPHDRNGTLTYISSGLEEGEEVVTRNQLLIYSELQK